jgi:MYXO-CTERM domain-containing protein
MMVWLDTRNGTGDLYVGRVDATGKMLDGSGVRVLAAPKLNLTYMPEIAWTGSSYVIVYLDTDVKALWIGADGSVLHGPTTLSTGTVYGSMLDVACAPDHGVCTATWVISVVHGSGQSEYPVYGQLDANGPLGTPKAVTASTLTPSVAWDGEGFVLGAGGEEVLAQWMTPQGALVGSGFQTVASNVKTYDAQPRMASSGSGETLYVWPHNGGRIEASLLTDDGMPDAGPDAAPDGSIDSGPANNDGGGQDGSADVDASDGGADANDSGADASDANSPVDASDSGPEADAGPDASDAGRHPDDAGSDAGQAADATVPIDPGASVDSGGCACDAAGTSRSSAPVGWLVAATALGLAASRRRARREQRG